MHALLCQGVMSSCLFHVLQALDCWSNLGGRLSHWNVPTAFQNFKPMNLLQPKRVEKHKKASRMSSTASELLTILPLVAHYLDAIKADTSLHSTAVLCSQAVNHLVEQFGATWHNAIVPEQIATQVEACLQLWKATGWHMFQKAPLASACNKQFEEPWVHAKLFCHGEKKQSCGPASSSHPKHQDLWVIHNAGAVGWWAHHCVIATSLWPRYCFATPQASSKNTASHGPSHLWHKCAAWNRYGHIPYCQDSAWCHLQQGWCSSSGYCHWEPKIWSWHCFLLSFPAKGKMCWLLNCWLWPSTFQSIVYGRKLANGWPSH